MSPDPSHAATPDDEVTLRGMRFHARVGILPHERELPQPLEVDLTAWIPARGIVVDYRELYALVAAVAAEPIDYLETAAEKIAHGALAVPGVGRVRVALRKPHVGLPGPLAHAEVAIVRPHP